MIEESDTIDMISESSDGVLWLTITDSGMTPEPDARYQLLIAKLSTYLAYLTGPQFARDFPGTAREKVKIRVMSATPATEKMAAIRQIRSRSIPVLEVPVEFVLFPAYQS